MKNKKVKEEKKRKKKHARIYDTFSSWEDICKK